jgi:hypothetical protein
MVLVIVAVFLAIFVLGLTFAAYSEDWSAPKTHKRKK